TIHAVVFAPDGRTLAAASDDAPVYVWDVLGLSDQQPPSTAELDECWTALAGPDAKPAFQAIRRLIAAPDAAVALLRQRLTPASPVDPKQVREFMRQLDSSRFTERQRAAAELEKLGDRVAADLRAALKDAPSAEVWTAVQRLLDKVDAGIPDSLRAVRAVE